MVDTKDAAVVVLGVLLVVSAIFGINEHLNLANARTTIAERDGRIKAIQADASRVLASETFKTLQLERALQDTHAQQENKDAQHAEIVAAKDLELRRRTRAGGGPGLRDPHAAACPNGDGGGTAPATATAAGDRAADRTEATGLLSPELERLLLDQAEAADRINVAYASCRADASAIRGEH